MQIVTDMLVPASNLDQLRHVITELPQSMNSVWRWIFARQFSEHTRLSTPVPRADCSFPLEFNREKPTMENTSPYRLEFDESKMRVSRSIPLGRHHIGTARMTTSIPLGVVNTKCAVFDLPNLYIATSAVFPTSSHANPTLMIVTLTVRLGEYLKATLGKAKQINSTMGTSAS